MIIEIVELTYKLITFLNVNNPYAVRAGTFSLTNRKYREREKEKIMRYKKKWLETHNK